MDKKNLRIEFCNEKFRRNMKEKLGKTCANCGSSEKIEYHHIVPIWNGGNNQISNIVPLCYTCHNKAHDKKSFKPKNAGRPVIITFENAEPILKRYFDLEIGMKQSKELLKISQKNKSTWYRLVTEYKNKHNIKVDFKNNIDLLQIQSRRIDSRKDVKKYKEGTKVY